MVRLWNWIRRQTVLSICLAAALVTVVLVPPDAQYLGYVDARVLGLLLCLMLTVAGLGQVGALDLLSQTLARRAPNERILALVLAMLCFFSSMVITNDVALITFVPLSVAAFSTPGQEKRMMLVVTLQTVAANLGSMLTPLGNPQNLYLYSTFQPGAAAFFGVTAPLTLVGGVLVAALTLLVRPVPVELTFPEQARIRDRRGLALLCALGAVCILAVFRVLPWQAALAAVAVCVLVWDRRLFRRVDWGLLATFVCFFVFVGNLQRIPAVRGVLASLIAGRELAAGVLCSQVISNVPAAVMLSGFTGEWRALVAGTNVGGLGTLIASLASLISFQYVARSPRADVKWYLGLFTLVNVALLGVLWAFAASVVSR